MARSSWHKEHKDTIFFHSYNCGFICSSATRFLMCLKFATGEFLIQLPLFSQDSIQVLPLLLMFLFFLWFINLQENIWTDWTDRNYCLQSAPHLFTLFLKYDLQENNPSNYTLLAASKKNIIIINNNAQEGLYIKQSYKLENIREKKENYISGYLCIPFPLYMSKL